MITLADVASYYPLNVFVESAVIADTLGLMSCVLGNESGNPSIAKA